MGLFLYFPRGLSLEAPPKRFFWGFFFPLELPRIFFGGSLSRVFFFFFGRLLKKSFFFSPPGKNPPPRRFFFRAGKLGRSPKNVMIYQTFSVRISPPFPMVIIPIMLFFFPERGPFLKEGLFFLHGVFPPPILAIVLSFLLRNLLFEI